MKKSTHTRRLAHLFDPAEIEHVLALLSQPSACSVLATLRDDLDAWLDSEPEAYEQEHGRAARALKETASAAARRLELGEAPGDVMPDIHMRWLEFVATAMEAKRSVRQVQHARGAAVAAEKRRERAADHPSRAYLDTAYVALFSETGKRPGRRALYRRAQAIAQKDGKPRELITLSRCQSYLKPK